MERLTFGYGTSGHGGEAPGRPDSARPEHRIPTEPEGVPPAAPLREVRDYAFLGLLAFTAVLYFRPQDTISILNHIRPAELAAVAGLTAMLFGRLSRGLPFTRVNLELLGVVAIGGVILMTAPFSVWPGGAIAVFTDMYVKIVLIFILMVNTLRTPRRVEQFIWLIVIASGYLALRAVIDYGRGINLIENDRVQGAVGGMFKNPNDLALNMVVVMPLAIFLGLRATRPVRRYLALFCAMLMAVTIVISHSRSGFIALVATLLMLGYYVAKRRPRLIGALAVSVLLATPMIPGSYWQRMASITDPAADETGSREARKTLMREAWATFVAYPVTGVGAGQFRNYNTEVREEPWRDVHNVLLQVAADIGVAGLLLFVLILARAIWSPGHARRLLRRARGSSREPPVVTPEEADMLDVQTLALRPAVAAWFLSAMFAPVAYNWTFYYLLALAIAPREILQDRLAARRLALKRAAATPPQFVAQEARA